MKRRQELHTKVKESAKAEHSMEVLDELMGELEETEGLRPSDVATGQRGRIRLN